jgi:hypothetical protein
VRARRDPDVIHGRLLQRGRRRETRLACPGWRERESACRRGEESAGPWVWAARGGGLGCCAGENRPGRIGSGLSKEELGWAAKREKGAGPRGKGLGQVAGFTFSFLFPFLFQTNSN